MPVTANFKLLRKKAGLTLREVEKNTGLSNSYLSQLENGKIKKPSFDTISKLINLYESFKKQNCCPCCGSGDTKEESIRQINYVYGPGSASWSILDYITCQNCGVMFKKIN